MVFPDQLDLTSFRILFRVALEQGDIEVTRTMSASLAVHKVGGEYQEGMSFTIYTETNERYQYWLSQKDVKNINEHYPDLSRAHVDKKFDTGIVYVSPSEGSNTKFTLYPTAYTMAKEKEDV
jgi:hypothetical protein